MAAILINIIRCACLLKSPNHPILVPRFSTSCKSRKSWERELVNQEMASVVWKVLRDGTFLKSIFPCVNLIPVRCKTHRKFPTRKRINPFVKPRTDLIKKLVLALVQHERIQTTHHKALQLKKYGDLVRRLSYDQNLSFSQVQMWRKMREIFMSNPTSCLYCVKIPTASQAKYFKGYNKAKFVMISSV